MLHKSLRCLQLLAFVPMFFSMVHADDDATRGNIVKANRIVPNTGGPNGTTTLAGHVVLGKTLQADGKAAFLSNVTAPSMNVSGQTTSGSVAASSINVSGQTTLRGNVIASHIRSVDATLGLPVQVLSDGTLGVLAVPSSETLKQDICEMGAVSKKIMDLNPVTFTYKNDPTKTQEFGLLAEQVETVFPKSGLVVRSQNGKPEAIRYHLLTPLLLNEYQQQQKQIQALLDRVNKLEQKK